MPAIRDGSGITVKSTKWIDQRLLDVTVASVALPSPVGVRILLPGGYRAERGTRYPVLYLLHGGGGSYVDWTTAGRAEQLTAGLPLIVVMPDGGPGGWYSDWSNSGAGGPPAWETFHIDELIPWVDANFRTIADRHGRAVAGLSMGGFGALTYAARHPDLFAAAASFSGAVDMNDPGLRYLVFLSPLIEGGPPGAIYGDDLFASLPAEARNPYNLASRLRRVPVAIYTGNGSPGPLDPPGTPGYDYNEFAVHEMSVALDRQLTRLGIAHTFDNYGNGTHTWPYWSRDLQEELPSMMAALSRPHGPSSHKDESSWHSTPQVAATVGVPSEPTAGTGAGPTVRASDSDHQGLHADIDGTPEKQPPRAVTGHVLHVSADGVDEGTCSGAHPCQTLSYATALARAGERVVVGDGSFPGRVTIGKNLTIVGSGSRTTLIGTGDAGAPVVTVAAGATGVVKDLTISNRGAFGDGIDSSGTLVADRVALSGNGGSGLDVMAGVATVHDATISANGAYGVANDGTLSLEGTTVSDNDYGVANSTKATILRSMVSDNDSGGIVTLRGSTIVRSSTVVGNHGEGVQAFTGTTTVEESTIKGNDFNGIAAEPTPYAPDPSITVVASTISGNSPYGLDAVTPIDVAGSIVTGNTTGDCAGAVTDEGHNVSGDATCPFVPGKHHPNLGSRASVPSTP